MNMQDFTEDELEQKIRETVQKMFRPTERSTKPVLDPDWHSRSYLITDRLKKAREDAVKSQREIAKDASVSNSLIARMDMEPDLIINDVYIRVLIATCRACNISADYLLGLTDEKNPMGYFGVKKIKMPK